MASLIRRHPLFDDLTAFWPRELFSRLREGGSMAEWSPRCDVTEGDDAIVVHAELPGVAAEDMEVSVADSRLIVRGEKRQEKKEEEGGRSYSERFFGSFERTIAIPAGVDQSKIEAKLKDGVLEVHVPLPEARKPEAKKIEIKGA